MLENMIDNDKLKRNFTFSLKKGKFKNIIYKSRLDVSCHNPLCTCQDLEVKIRLNNDSIKEEEQLYLFYINLGKKSISPDYTKKISPESMEFGSAFIKEIKSEDWLTLQQFLLSAKTDIHEHTDLKELEVEFDDDLIKNNSMIAWHEIFPFAKQIIKDNNSSKYLLDDQYCLQPDCTCTHTALCFIKIENNKAVNKKPNACYFNYNKNTLEPLDGPITGEIREIITKYGSEFKNEYRERHKILRKLYRDYKERSGLTDTETVLNITQPGRNDPCPCGSGKKFKKCCMS